MSRSIGALFTQPVPQSYAGTPLAEGLFPSKTAAFERFLQQAQTLGTVLEFPVAFCDLPGEGCGEPESVLQIPDLHIEDEILCAELSVMEQQPGKRLNKPWIELVKRKTRQKDLLRISQRPAVVSVCKAGVAETCELHVNPLVRRATLRSGGAREGKPRRGQIEQANEPTSEPGGYSASPGLHEREVGLCHTEAYGKLRLRPPGLSSSRIDYMSLHDVSNI